MDINIFIKISHLQICILNQIHKPIHAHPINLKIKQIHKPVTHIYTYPYTLTYKLEPTHPQFTKYKIYLQCQLNNTIYFSNKI